MTTARWQAANAARQFFRSRPVADACGAPVLRDQGPIGRPGTARPMLNLDGSRLGAARREDDRYAVDVVTIRGSLSRPVF